MKKLAILSLVMLTALLGGMVTGAVTLAAQDVHWGYTGEAGPEHWGELSPDYAACSAGREQSPVDIPSSAPLNSSGITFNYQPSALNIINNGHVIQVNYDAGSSITVEGKTYNLVQYHFHAMSEHTMSGQHTPIEMHLVHQADDKSLAVVGVMLTQGAENTAYAPTWGHLPAHEGPAATVAGVMVDAAAMLPANRAYYRYNGSLTTPACSEGVKWHVLQQPVQLSAAQIAALTAIYSNDYRPTQPLNARTFLLSTDMMAGGAPGMPTTGNDALALALAALAGVGLVSIGTGWVLVRRRA